LRRGSDQTRLRRGSGQTRLRRGSGQTGTGGGCAVIDVLAAPLAFSIFRDVYAQVCLPYTDTPTGIAQRLRNRSAGTKHKLPLIKLATFGALRSAENCLRHDDNVLTVSGAEGDYDREELSFDRGCGLLFASRLASIVYTSPSFTPERPRWRVLVPFSKPLDPSLRRPMLARVNGVLGGVLAGESFTLSQSFFAGFVRANACNHKVELIPGDAVDLRADLDTDAIGPVVKPAKATNAGADGEAIEDAELVRVIVTGETGLHPALTALAARHIGRGTPSASVETTLRGLMESWPEDRRDARWHKRRGEIPGIVASAVKKFRPEDDLIRAAFRECASVLMTMSRDGCSAENMHATALSRLAQHGVDATAAEQMLRRVIGWCERKLLEESSNG
jgi:hypothetical protein